MPRPLPPTWKTETAAVRPTLLRQAVLFRTRRLDDPAPFVRTVGTVVGTGPGDLHFPAASAMRYGYPHPPAHCARGKVVAITESGAAIAYQLSDCYTQAEVVACSNATAAAAAWLGQQHQCPKVVLKVELPMASRVVILANVRAAHAGCAWLVEQVWQRVAFSIHSEIRIAGRHGAICAGPLNNYLLLRAHSEADLATFSVDDAVQAWAQAALDEAPLRARIGVIAPSTAGVPNVRFFTCGDRAHPSAPLTGLAVLALAARYLDWLPSAPAAMVNTPGGQVALPPVRVSADQLARIRFPPVIVDFPAATLV